MEEGKGAGLWPVPFLAAGIALVLMAFPALGDRFQWIQGDPWAPLRWVGCHWTHWSWTHVVWDALVFAVLGLWAQRLSPRGFYWTLGLSVLAIPVAIGFLLPDLPSYRGLSGLDSALFCLVATHLAIEAHRLKKRWDLFIICFLMGGFALKVLFEIVFSTSFFAGGSEIMVPIPLAHAVGGFIGSAVAGALARSHPLAK